MGPSEAARRAELGIGRLFESIRDAVIVADVRTGTISLWNPAATAVFGWTAEEAMGRPIEIVVPPRLREHHHAGLANYQRTGHGKYVDADATLRLPGLRKDGREIDVEMVLSPLEDADGGRFMVAIIRDVSDRVKAEEEMRAANRALSRANEDLEAFTYVVSHDLKEPVRALVGILEALEEDHATTLPPDARHLIGLARRSSTSLWQQIERLLEYGRASRGALEHAPVDLASIVRSEQCSVLYSRFLANGDHALHVSPDIPLVAGDETALCQVIGNLISNAFRHNASPHPLVRVEGDRVGGEVEVRVIDNGKGFPPRVLAAFAKGALAPGAGPRGGFGLAIARRAIERLDGSIRIENAPEGGAIVTLRLPAAHEPLPP